MNQLFWSIVHLSSVIVRSCQIHSVLTVTAKRSNQITSEILQGGHCHHAASCKLLVLFRITSIRRHALVDLLSLASSMLRPLTFWRTRRDAQCTLSSVINADLKSQPDARICCQMSRCVAVWTECAASRPEIGYMPWKLCTIPPACLTWHPFSDGG